MTFVIFGLGIKTGCWSGSSILTSLDQLWIDKHDDTLKKATSQARDATRKAGHPKVTGRNRTKRRLQFPHKCPQSTWKQDDEEEADKRMPCLHCPNCSRYAPEDDQREECKQYHFVRGNGIVFRNPCENLV